MQTEQQKQALALLHELGKKGSVPALPLVGICANIRNQVKCSLNNTFPEYYSVITRWKYYSGKPTFPVPLSLTENNCVNAYGKDMWTGTYGEMRRMFARYLVREFTKLYPPNK